MTRRTFLLCLIISFTTIFYIQADVLAAASAKGKDPKAKYVFLFIGDGMGQAQVNLTQAYMAAIEDKPGFKELTFTTFPNTGFVSTFANNRLITCSAAAGTALATGHKTNIDRISMDPEGKVIYETIAEKAKDAGYKVGIITSVSIDHATPAVFYAHQPDRDMYFEIGVELTQSDFDFFAGGGFKIPEDTLDGKLVNLVELAKENGYTVTGTRADFEKLGLGSGKTLVQSPRMAGEATMPYYLDMDPVDLTLADYTDKAIDVLANKKGFFMMVESGKIDWACHSNDAAAAIQEVAILDMAVQHAYEFYQEHPDETLIIVTADHETGGLSIGARKTKYDTNIELLKYQLSSVEELNKIVNQFRENRAGSPDEEFTRMMKIMETEIGLNSMKYNTLLEDEEVSNLRKIFNESVYGTGAEEGTYGDYGAFIAAAISLMAEKAGIGWTTGSHTAVSVPLYAIGAGADRFSGYLDNTDIPKIIGEMMGVE